MSVLKDCPGPAQARAEPMGLESGFKVALDPGLARDQHWSQHSEWPRPGLHTPELALSPWLEGPVVQK